MAFSLMDSAATLLGKVRFRVRYPGSAVEIGPDTVTAVNARKERGGVRVFGYGLVPFEGWDLQPAGAPLKGAALEGLRYAIAEAVRAAGLKAGKASLVLPDTAARVWLLQLPEIPRSRDAMLELVRWKVKRSVPMRIEDAVISWQVLSRPSNGQQGVVLAGLLPHATVVQLEALLAEQGLKVGLVDLSSFNLYNLLRPQLETNGVGQGDYAVINATTGYFTLMIFRRTELIFYRCKAHAVGEGGEPEERAKTLHRELAASLSYYTEKLRGVRLAKTVGRMADPAVGDVSESLTELGFAPLEEFDLSTRAVLPRGTDAQAALALMPAVGATLGRNG